jgi:flagellar basal-body rod protein FlgG
MVRGIYTGAAGMLAQMDNLDAVANNLANVSTPGYKEDVTIFKSFPEMLLRRQEDDAVVRIPIGSYDKRPVVGKLGTGVEVEEFFTRFTQGPVRQTGNDFDLALEGEGFFCLLTDEGERYTRNGSFSIRRDGTVVSKDGHLLLGESGPIRIQENNFRVEEDGRVVRNGAYANDPEVMVSRERNGWELPETVDRLRIVRFEEPRELKKQGGSLTRATRYSGPPVVVEADRPKVRQGFLEMSNVNPVTEMVHMIEVHRAYEASQKAVLSHDQTLGRLVNEVASLR